MNGELWGVKKTTIPVLAFAATAVRVSLLLISFLLMHHSNNKAFFILTGEAKFTECGAKHDFLLFYTKHIELLTKSAQQVTKRKEFVALMDYYNQQLFPDDEADLLDNLMDKEKLMLEALDDEEDKEAGVEEYNGYEEQ